MGKMDNWTSLREHFAFKKFQQRMFRDSDDDDGNGGGGVFTLGPNDEILRTHSTVNMAVKIRLRSANTSENSRGAPWN